MEKEIDQPIGALWLVDYSHLQFHLRHEILLTMDVFTAP